MDGFKLLEHIGLELDLPVISECCRPCWGFLTAPAALMCCYCERLTCDKAGRVGGSE